MFINDQISPVRPSRANDLIGRIFGEVHRLNANDCLPRRGSCKMNGHTVTPLDMVGAERPPNFI